MMNSRNSDTEAGPEILADPDSPAALQRINGRYILREFKDLVLFERGFFYTLRELVLRPAESVKRYLFKDRGSLVKPVLFIIVSSLVYTLVNHFFQIEDGYVNVESDSGSALFVLGEWVQNNYGYANIIMGLFIALWVKLFFRKYDVNFFEILVLLCYVMGVGMLIFATFALIQGLTGIDVMLFAGFVGIGYTTWAIGQFFEKGKWGNYLKAFFSYLFGMVAFSMAVVAIGLLIDLL